MTIRRDDDEGQLPPSRRRRAARALGMLVVVLVTTAALVAGLALVVLTQIDGNIRRFPDVFGGLDESQRPAATGALTFLLVGIDVVSDDPTTGTNAVAAADSRGGQRSDAIMVVSVAPDRRSASVVSVPRDSWVPVPGLGTAKINAAYAIGGPTMLVSVVEQLTRIRIDHVMVIDYAGFRSMTDAVGGIDVYVAQATETDGIQFRQGFNHLDGAQTLAYVRQRKGLPSGDLDRTRRQQNALKELLGRAVAGGLQDPLQTYRFLDALSRSVTVDDTLDSAGLRGLAFELGGLRPARIAFLNAPVAGFGQEGDESVVYLDDSRSAELWESINSDRMGDYLRSHPQAALAPVPF